VSREDQDAFALESHEKASLAQRSGWFDSEIAPLEITERTPDLAGGRVETKTRTLRLDEGVRADTSLEALGKLRPAFAASGSVTAGNSSQMSDGAGALLLVSEKFLRQFELTPLARFVSFAVKGVPPEVMGVGPIQAIPAALALACLKQDELGWVELNEAFAAQSLAVLRELRLDPKVVNPLGGAIALGHPLGATGAMLLDTALDELERSGKSTALITLCIGGGMGIATIIERV
jgi:acetyl-CoA acyltransferase